MNERYYSFNLKFQKVNQYYGVVIYLFITNVYTCDIQNFEVF